MQTGECVDFGEQPSISRCVVAKERSKVVGVVTTVQITTQYGVEINRGESRRFNLVVNSGRNNLARLLGGDSSLSVAYLALGDSKTSAPALTDAALENEVKRVAFASGDKTYPSTGSVLFSRTVTGDEFSDVTVVREGGLVLSDGSITLDTGTLFNRVVFVDDNALVGLVNAGLIFQPTNASGVAINNKIEFEILF